MGWLPEGQSVPLFADSWKLTGSRYFSMRSADYPPDARSAGGRTEQSWAARHGATISSEHGATRLVSAPGTPQHVLPAPQDPHDTPCLRRKIAQTILPPPQAPRSHLACAARPKRHALHPPQAPPSHLACAARPPRQALPPPQDPVTHLGSPTSPPRHALPPPQDPATHLASPARPPRQALPPPQAPPTRSVSARKTLLTRSTTRPGSRNRANQGSRLFFLTRRMRDTTVASSFGG